MKRISRDGVTLAIVPGPDVMQWFHTHTSHSAWSATHGQGYQVEDLADGYSTLSPWNQRAKHIVH